MWSIVGHFLPFAVSSGLPSSLKWMMGKNSLVSPWVWLALWRSLLLFSFMQLNAGVHSSFYCKSVQMVNEIMEFQSILFLALLPTLVGNTWQGEGQTFLGIWPHRLHVWYFPENNTLWIFLNNFKKRSKNSPLQ